MTKIPTWTFRTRDVSSGLFLNLCYDISFSYIYVITTFALSFVPFDLKCERVARCNCSFPKEEIGVGSN